MIEIYSTRFCPFCIRAKRLLEHLELSYIDHDVSQDWEKRQEMGDRSSRHTVPQIFIDDKPIGGSDELISLYQSGELVKLISDDSASETQ